MSQVNALGGLHTFSFNPPLKMFYCKIYVYNLFRLFLYVLRVKTTGLAKKEAVLDCVFFILFFKQWNITFISLWFDNPVPLDLRYGVFKRLSLAGRGVSRLFFVALFLCG